MSNQFQKWSSFYTDADEKILRYPNEPLARIMKGSYIPGLKKDYKGKKVLDIGFGHGNNLLFLQTLGFEIFGIEVQKEICGLVMDRLKSYDIASDLRYGTNQKIPFDDNMFDALVSWDVLHYEGNDANYHLALKEYQRVLKPGGRLFLSTVAPKSSVLRNAKILEPHCYQLTREDDFRVGEVFFCCDEEAILQSYLSTYFMEILVGRATDELFAETYDSFIATALKGT